MTTLVFAEFNRASNLEPSLSSFRKYFSDIEVVLYTDYKVEIEGVKVFVVDPPYEKTQKRYGNRCNDYYKVYGLLRAETEYTIAVDSDMMVVSEKATTILNMTKKFGFCLPANPRYLVRVDNTIGEDSNKNFDESEGYGYIPNMSPITMYNGDERAKCVLERYLEQMAINPVRGPVAMWNAIWHTGIFPCLLPIQWCVCGENCGVGNELILHVGHRKVRDFYRV